MKRTLLIPLLIIIAVITLIGYIQLSDTPEQSITAKKPANQRRQPAKTTTQTFDKQKYSLNTAGSPWWIVNKQRPVTKGYVPPELTVPNLPLRLNASAEQMKLSSVAATALEQLFSAAKAQNLSLRLASGYRSEAYQAQLYNGYVAKDGQAAADRYSARPGTSEHQTGLAVDVGRPDAKCELEICFGDLPEGQWLADNAHTHGYIVRYLNGKEASTGYQFEPWHLRYVGTELATELFRTKQTMEEYFGL